MNTELKTQVKNIFSALKFEDALDATRNLRGEYISEYGAKSWNGLVAYYKKANIHPSIDQIAIICADPEEQYPEAVSGDILSSGDDEKDELPWDGGDPSLGEQEFKGMSPVMEETPKGDQEDADIVSIELSPENVEVLHNTLANIFGEEEITEAKDRDNEEELAPSEAYLDVEQDANQTIEYMIYRNIGEKIEWFGHRENFFKMKAGETARIIRMNSCGVSEAMIVAVQTLTLDEINLFHKCYKEISKMHRSYAQKFDLTLECFSKISGAFPNSSVIPKRSAQLLEAVLNRKA